jgi:hypothetical protein
MMCQTELFHRQNYTDHHANSRTQSKIHSVNDLSVQIFFFPLHEVILFQGNKTFQERDLQLGIGVQGLS